VIRPVVQKALAGWKAKVPYKRIERPAVLGVAGGHELLDTPDKENAVTLAGLTLPLRDTDPDIAALEIGKFLFGGGSLSSRLGNRVRQKEGLSYGVGSSFNASDLDPSSRFQIFAISNPKNAPRVNTAILDELDQLLRSGIGNKEMEEGKKAFLAQMK